MGNRDGAARELILRYGWNATAFQVLNPGVAHWFSAACDAVVGYDEYASTRVVVGAPAGANARPPEGVGDFERGSAGAARRVMYFGAGSRLEKLGLANGGYAFLQLGAQPVWE